MPSLSTDALGLAVTVLGGLHYGYSVGIVGVCSDELQALLGQSTVALSLASSLPLLGAFIGSPVSGAVCERFGRRVGTIIGETIILVGSAICAVPQSWPVLWMGRVIVGVGIGFCTLAKPVYVKETVSPARVGPCLAVFAPAVASGLWISRTIGSAVSGPSSLPLLMSLAAVPALVILLLAFTCMPETEAWLSRRQATSERAGVDRTSAAQANSGGGGGVDAPLCFGLAAMLGVANQGTGSYLFNVYGSQLLPLSPAEDAMGASANVLGAVLVVPLLAMCRNRVLLAGGLFGMVLTSVTVVVANVNGGGEPASSEALHMLLFASVLVWSILYQVGPGGCYYAQVVEVAADSQLRPMTIALGNTLKYGTEFASSLLLIGVTAAYGVEVPIVFFAAVALASAVGVLALLPEANRRFATIDDRGADAAGTGRRRHDDSPALL